MKSKSGLLKLSFVGLSFVAAAAAAAACSTTDAGDNSASAGTGATTSSGGTSGSTSTAGQSASTAGTGGAPVTNNAVACGTASSATLLDFSAIDGGASTGSFGDYTTSFSGYTFLFPNTLASDFSMENWHVTGMVGDFAGLVIGFSKCTKVDLSAYKGITFSVKGSIPAPMNPNTLTLSVGTAADDITSVWLNAHKSDPTAADTDDNFGRCTPKATQYDGSCGSPTHIVPVTDTATVINVTWAQLLGGAPAATVNPSEITSIVWVIPAPAGAGGSTPATPYAIDVTLDDIGFIQ